MSDNITPQCAAEQGNVQKAPFQNHEKTFKSIGELAAEAVRHVTRTPAEWREAKRIVVFNADDLHDALDQVVIYAKGGIDQEYAINGLPRSVLPWRMPSNLCTASAILAAHYLAEGRETAGAEMIANAMFMADTDSVIEGLCLAEDLAIVSDNFTERFGEDA